MYKIYINETALLLMKTADLSAEYLEGSNQLISRYPNNRKFLLSHLDLMEKNQRFERVIIHATDLDNLWSDMKKLLKTIRAAGGLVYAADGQVLAIYRMGFWDLPKGKIEKGESKKVAARREVMEETGILELEVDHRLLKTYHIYRDTRYKKRVLKKTYWYKMKGESDELVPQSEEDIEKALWIKPDALLAKTPIYQNIIDVIRQSEG